MSNLLYYYFYNSKVIIGRVILVIYPSIDKILTIVDSKYELVHLVANRSKEMTRTGFYQMDEGEYKSKKEIGRALEEVYENLITIKKK